ncbi:MAG: hypothetical protein KGJ86_06570 [Chloroflexota bacterium]|nr:hypothetical protein [Chloroflexota bacterium]
MAQSKKTNQPPPAGIVFKCPCGYVIKITPDYPIATCAHCGRPLQLPLPLK